MHSLVISHVDCENWDRGLVHSACYTAPALIDVIDHADTDAHSLAIFLTNIARTEIVALLTLHATPRPALIDIIDHTDRIGDLALFIVNCISQDLLIAMNLIYPSRFTRVILHRQ
jgi:hypothetical protein